METDSRGEGHPMDLELRVPTTEEFEFRQRYRIVDIVHRDRMIKELGATESVHPGSRQLPSSSSAREK